MEITTCKTWGKDVHSIKNCFSPMVGITEQHRNSLIVFVGYVECICTAVTVKDAPLALLVSNFSYILISVITPL